MASPDPRSPARRIADELRARIESGELPPGAQLPTMRELVAQYDVASATANQAFSQLKAAGLVVTRPGAGAFVRERMRPKRHGIDRYARSRWQRGTTIHDGDAGSQGLSVKQVYREIDEVPAPAVVAVAFDVPKGEKVWVRRRTTIIDGRPHQLADSYYPLDLALGTRLTEEDSGPGGGFARLDEAGDPLAEISEEWTTRMPAISEAVALQLPAGTPVMDLTRIVYDAKGRAVEVMLAVIAGDTVTMSYRFPIPD